MTTARWVRVTQVINVLVSKFPTDVFQPFISDPIKLEYAAVYFSDPDSINRVIRYESKSKQQGYFVASINNHEGQFLNLKKSETGEEHKVILSRLLEYIYICYKTNMLEQCVRYCDYFLNYLQKRCAGKFCIDAVGQASTVLSLTNRTEFRPELITTASFSPKSEEVFSMQQLILWLKLLCFSKLSEDTKIVENYVKFSLYYFIPFTLEGVDTATDSVLKNIWRVNFIMENMKIVEMVARIGSSDRTLHWMMSLLSVLQASYYELAKTYYKFNEDVAHPHPVRLSFSTPQDDDRKRRRQLRWKLRC